MSHRELFVHRARMRNDANNSGDDCVGNQDKEQAHTSLYNRRTRGAHPHFLMISPKIQGSFLFRLCYSFGTSLALAMRLFERMLGGTDQSCRQKTQLPHTA